GTEWSGSFANALDEPPTFVERRQADIEPCAVASGELERLRLEHARERNAPPGRSTRGEQWREHNERLGEDVGHHDVVELGRQRFGSRGTHRCAVGARVRRGDLERLRIDIDRVDPRRAELCRSDRQYTRAATVVEDALAAPQLPLEKAQHESRAGMAACAAREPGVEPN